MTYLSTYILYTYLPLSYRYIHTRALFTSYTSEYMDACSPFPPNLSPPIHPLLHLVPDNPPPPSLIKASFLAIHVLYTRPSPTEHIDSHPTMCFISPHDVCYTLSHLPPTPSYTSPSHHPLQDIVSLFFSSSWPSSFPSSSSSCMGMT